MKSITLQQIKHQLAVDAVSDLDGKEDKSLQDHFVDYILSGSTGGYLPPIQEAMAKYTRKYVLSDRYIKGPEVVLSVNYDGGSTAYYVIVEKGDLIITQVFSKVKV
jgi:hypothetical protein